MPVARDPIMDLPILTVATNVSKGTPAQDWAYLWNEIFTIFDAHTHGEGSGVKISSENLVADDFDLNNFSIAGVNYVTFQPAFNVINKSFHSLGADNDLYFKDGNGNDVRFTDAGALAVSASLIGGFTGDYVTDNAMAVFAGEKNLFSFYGANGADNAEILVSNLQIADTISVFTGTFSAVINGTAPLYFASYIEKAPVTNGTTDTIEFYPCSYRPYPNLPTGTPQIWRRSNQGSIQIPSGELNAYGNDLTPFAGEKYWMQPKNNNFVADVNKNHRLYVEVLYDAAKIIRPQTFGQFVIPYIVLIGSRLVYMKPVFTPGNIVDGASFDYYEGLKVFVTLAEGEIIVSYDAVSWKPRVITDTLTFELHTMWMLPVEDAA